MELNKSISYKELMTNILPNKLKKYMSEDTFSYLIEIFTPDMEMEDNKNLSYTLSEWIKYFINTSLVVIRDTIEFEDNNKDTLEIYDQYIYGTWKDQNTFTFYTDEEKTNSIADYQLTDNEITTKNINYTILKSSKEYKHTYKLDKTTNNYYWVSSEPIEYNE